MTRLEQRRRLDALCDQVDQALAARDLTEAYRLRAEIRNLQRLYYGSAS